MVQNCRLSVLSDHFGTLIEINFFLVPVHIRGKNSKGTCSGLL